MRMCCNDPNAPHHKNEEQPKEASQKSSPEQPTLFRGALWIPVSKSKVRGPGHLCPRDTKFGNP